MSKINHFFLLVALLTCNVIFTNSHAAITLNMVGTFETGLGEGSGEISSYDSGSQRLFVINSDATTFAIVNLTDPSNPTLIDTIDLSAFGGGLTSIAANDGLVAVAVEANIQTDPGSIRLYDTNGIFIAAIVVGALPDMVTFNQAGNLLLVANEGEPDNGIDPLGSISIIDLSSGVATATVNSLDFTAFNSGQPRNAELPADIILFPGVDVANDLEPEFIAVSEDDSQAFVVLQESNAVAVINLNTQAISSIHALGFKDHSQPGNELDPSDRDSGIEIASWPVFGMYMPDAIASYNIAGQDYYLTANEGDARDEDQRIEDFILDPIVFPNATSLQAESALGRLEITTILGDIDSDNDHDILYAYGARSFSIWNASTGVQTYDSGSEFEQNTALLAPAIFNSNGGTIGSFDSRSDAKGPEPEGIVVGNIDSVPYAFIGLERTGGVMVYDISNPDAAEFISYTQSPDGDMAPEGLVFIAGADNETGSALLLVSHEDSGVVTIYQILTAEIFTDGFE